MMICHAENPRKLLPHGLGINLTQTRRLVKPLKRRNIPPFQDETGQEQLMREIPGIRAQIIPLIIFRAVVDRPRQFAY
jgi:hypothetical protein